MFCLRLAARTLAGVSVLGSGWVQNAPGETARPNTRVSQHSGPASRERVEPAAMLLSVLITLLKGVRGGAQRQELPTVYCGTGRS